MRPEVIEVVYLHAPKEGLQGGKHIGYRYPKGLAFIPVHVKLQSGSIGVEGSVGHSNGGLLIGPLDEFLGVLVHYLNAVAAEIHHIEGKASRFRQAGKCRLVKGHYVQLRRGSAHGEELSDYLIGGYASFGKIL